MPFELFEIMDIKTHKQTDTHTDRYTHRHIHANENNTCLKTKFMGKVNEKRVPRS